MPINGMFTLADAVPAMQQGQAWRQAQDQNQRALKQQASMDEANGIVAQGVKDAEADHLKRQRAAWLASGQDETAFKPEPFKPTDKLMFDLSGKRGLALMKAGLVEQAVANEALVQQQRLRVRQGALERFKTDRDHARLATAINDTNPDGREIKKITTIEGVSGLDASPGSPASAPIPQKIRIEFSDGSIVDEEPKKIEAYALALSDPQHASKEAALHLARLTAKAQADERIRVARVRGEEARATDDRRTRNDRTLADVNNSAAQKRVETQGRYGVQEANIRASASAKEGKAPEGRKRLSAKELQAMVEDSYGQLTQGGFGSKRIGNNTTAKIAEGASAYLDQYPEATESQAINAAAKRLGVKPNTDEQ